MEQILARLMLLVCALGLHVLYMQNAWGLKLESLGWLIGCFLALAIISLISDKLKE